MIAVFTAPDAAVIAALLAAAASTGGAWLSAHRAARQTRPNGGTSMRDAIDRIESRLDEVVQRLDRGATRLADHDDRLAVVESRDPHARDRHDDPHPDRRGEPT